MTYSPLLILHICAAIITVPVGSAALILRKGSPRHRALGNVFFISMLLMTATGGYIGFMKQQSINFVVGVLTFYLVATAWKAAKRKEGEIGMFEVVAMLVAFGIGTVSIVFGREGAQSPTGLKDGFPAIAYFIFGSIALFAAALDSTVLLRRGISGAQRIARHLWRMCFALLIAALSLFLGKQQHFPAVLRKTHLLPVPVILIALATIYWFTRVLFWGAHKEGRWRDFRIWRSSSPSVHFTATGRSKIAVRT